NRLGVELPHRKPKAVRQYNLVLRIPAKRASGTEGLVERIYTGPTELFQQFHARLLHVERLGTPRLHHAAEPSSTASRSSPDTSICPVTSFGSSMSRRAASRAVSRCNVSTWAKSGNATSS